MFKRLKVKLSRILNIYYKIVNYMAQQIKLNEEQMREYVEQEVRKALMNENIDENMTDEGLLNRIAGLLFGNGNGEGGNSMLGNLIKSHMNFPDLLNLAIGIFGVAPLVKWICGKFGIDVNGVLGQAIVTALSGAGTVAIGDAIQNARGRNLPAAGE